MMTDENTIATREQVMASASRPEYWNAVTRRYPAHTMSAEMDIAILTSLHRYRACVRAVMSPVLPGFAVGASQSRA